MLKHDQYWNWNIKRGDKVRSIVNNDDLKNNEIYEVIIPQSTPSGIVVKNITGKEIHSFHENFEDIE